MVKRKFIDLKKRIIDYLQAYDGIDRLPGVRELSVKLNSDHRTIMKSMRLLANERIVTIRPRSGIYINKISTRAISKKNTVGIVGFNSQYDNEEYLTINHMLKERGFEPFIIDTDPKLFRNKPELLLDFPVGSFIFYYGSLSSPGGFLLKDNMIPFVTTDNSIGLNNFNWVTFDMGHALEDVLKFLLKLGHRKIAVILYRDDRNQFVLNMKNVYCDTMTSAGCYNANLFYDSHDPAEYLNTNQDAYETYGLIATDRLLKYGATAIIAPDAYFLGIEKAVKSKGLKIPDDISCISIADYHTKSDRTMITFSAKERAMNLVERVIDVINHPELPPQNIIIKYQILIGNSTAQLEYG